MDFYICDDVFISVYLPETKSCCELVTLKSVVYIEKRNSSSSTPRRTVSRTDEPNADAREERVRRGVFSWLQCAIM